MYVEHNADQLLFLFRFVMLLLFCYSIGFNSIQLSDLKHDTIPNHIIYNTTKTSNTQILGFLVTTAEERLKVGRYHCWMFTYVQSATVDALEVRPYVGDRW